ncbi:MAG: tail fiber domain-containing protein [Terriglobales bacterium]
MKKVQVVMISALLLFCSAWSQAQQGSASTINSGPVNESVNKEAGKGSTDYVPLWLSTTKLGNSIMFQSAGGIGINTTSPGATLDVSGNINSAKGYNLGGIPFVMGSKLGNTFVGYAVGNSTTTGGSNTGIGYATFQDNTTGTFNTALGEAALSVSTTGSDNTGAGAGALEANTTGSNNTATGWAALLDNTTGNYNTATGSGALYFNTTGNTNTAIGTDALELNTTGINNSALGTYALLWNTTGNYNTGAGFDAGFAMDGSKLTGSNNTVIGLNTAFSTGSLTNATAVGAYAVVGSNNALVLGCVSGVNNCTTTTTVGIGTSTPTNLLTLGQGQGPAIADGWSTYSSRRWKTNIQTLHGALAKVEQLRGVSYDLQANGKHEVGVIAEEVGAVVPELVTFEKNGKDAQSVDYSRLTALLIEATKEQQALIEQQQAQIEQLTSQVKTIQTSLNTRDRTEVHTLQASLTTVHQ